MHLLDSKMEERFVPPTPPRKDSSATSRHTDKVFRKADCEFLQAQLLGVRSYLDNMIDDEFDDKREQMMALQSVINALAFIELKP